MRTNRQTKSRNYFYFSSGKFFDSTIRNVLLRIDVATTFYGDHPENLLIEIGFKCLKFSFSLRFNLAAINNVNHMRQELIAGSILSCKIYLGSLFTFKHNASFLHSNLIKFDL